MPNWCAIHMHLEFELPSDAAECRNVLQNAHDEADKRNCGFTLGDGFYMFGAEIQALTDKELLVNADIKWGFDAKELEKFLEYIESRGWSFIRASCKFAEPMNIYYGWWNYEHDTKLLMKTWVKDSYMSAFYDAHTEKEQEADNWLERVYDHAMSAPDDECDTWTAQLGGD